MADPSSRTRSTSLEKTITMPPQTTISKGSALSALPETHFTVFIRLPFPRADFEDPPPVEWNAAKERALWRVLSQASGGSDINWDELAGRFQAPLPFLLQQAAWLYERQLSQVRAQMRRVGKSGASNTASPAPGSASGSGTPGGQQIKGGGSTGMGARVPSSLSLRSKDSPIIKGESSRPSTPTKPTAPMMSRASSGQTVQGGPAVSPSPRQTSGLARRPSYQRPSKIETIMQDPSDESHPVLGRSISPVDRGESLDNESSSQSESESQTAQSQAFQRPPPHLSSKSRAGPYRGQEDDDEDDSPAFLPVEELPAVTRTEKGKSPRVDAKSQEPSSRRPTPNEHERQRIQPQVTRHSSASSTSSHPASLPPTETGLGPSHQRRPRGPLSPRRTAELATLAGRSPRRHGPSKPGSDGTPSMGSSFSDLDADTSVTQSALEEALLSNMQGGAGGVASRMSSISQALRSRYL
ncbi:MAG: hypothetical protein M1816_002456 [Peltula sp. TS41687]|nr:MAG: hypothetical protein M1816_002456 [Peltula sp. TS41687]